MSEPTTSEVLEQAIRDGAASPEMVQNSRLGLAKERSLTQLLDARDRLDANDAVSGKRRGLRFTRLSGPPAV